MKSLGYFPNEIVAWILLAISVMLTAVWESPAALAQTSPDCGTRLGGWFLASNPSSARVEIAYATAREYAGDEEEAIKHWDEAKELLEDYLTCNDQVFNTSSAYLERKQYFEKELECVIDKIGWWTGSKCKKPTVKFIQVGPVGMTAGAPNNGRIPLIYDECDSTTGEIAPLLDVFGGCIPESCRETYDCIGWRRYLVLDPLLFSLEQEPFLVEPYASFSDGSFPTINGVIYFSTCDESNQLSILLGQSCQHVNFHLLTSGLNDQYLAIPLTGIGD